MPRRRRVPGGSKRSKAAPGLPAFEFTNHRTRAVAATCPLHVLLDLLNPKSQLTHVSAITKDKYTYSFVTEHNTGFGIARRADMFGIKYSVGSHELEDVEVNPD